MLDDEDDNENGEEDQNSTIVLGNAIFESNIQIGKHYLLPIIQFEIITGYLF